MQVRRELNAIAQTGNTPDHISSILFCPTQTSVMNLKKEGITEGVFLVGDVMYDAFLFNKELSGKKSDVLRKLELNSGCYSLATVHRQENTDDPGRLLNIFKVFNEISTGDIPLVVMLHPRTRRALQNHNSQDQSSSNVRFLSPASYLDMIALESHAKVILTDSGGVQKEAYFAQVPCVTLREETEWTETVEDGWNLLVGADPVKIMDAFEKAIDSLPKIQSSPFGDGNASQRLVRHLASGFADHLVTEK
jgi:UDP-N-acetylglucosamine 2-epimerase